jgi:hypothetical protein
VSEWDRNLHWNYSKNPHGWTCFGHDYWYTNVWRDHEDPTWQGRPG